MSGLGTGSCCLAGAIRCDEQLGFGIKVYRGMGTMVLQIFLMRDLPCRRSREGGSPGELADPLRISLDSRLRGNDGE